MTWRGLTSRTTWTDVIAGPAEVPFPGIPPSRRTAALSLPIACVVSSRRQHRSVVVA
jgi:hypothetical protein